MLTKTAPASHRDSTPTMKREVLLEVGTISIRVPVDAREGEAPLPEGAMKYVQFAQCVRGGMVNFFVHGANPARFREKRIIAKTTILKKTLPNGQEYLHVDLLPIDDQASRPTHRLAVMSGGREIAEREGQILFLTPKPLGGVIVLAPVGSKILTIDSN